MAGALEIGREIARPGVQLCQESGHDATKDLYVGFAIVVWASIIAAAHRPVTAQAPAPTPASGAVTYARDVLPILQNLCQSCHRPGQIGPMSFLDYASTRPWAQSIKAKVRSREMPPWDADPAYGHFTNDRSLSRQEIDTLTAWADSGAASAAKT